MKRRFFRANPVAWTRVVALVIFAGSLFMWLRSSLLQKDSITLRTPNRVWQLQSGRGEVEFLVAGRIGTGWELSWGSSGIGGPPRWFRSLRYQRTPISLSIAVGYNLIVLALGVVLYALVLNLTRPGRRTRKAASRKRSRKRKG